MANRYSFLHLASGLVMDVQGAKPDNGIPLDIWSQNSPASENQLWTFEPAPADDPGAFFIKSALSGGHGNPVIDVQGAKPDNGTSVDIWSQNSPASKNQLWKSVSSTPNYGSSNNAKLFSNNNCKSLQNLTVTFQVTRDLVTFGNNGCSLQLNCYPQTDPQATYKATGAPLNWFQYVINVYNEQVQWGIQYWAVHPKYKGQGYSPSPNYVKFASAPSNQVPSGSVMSISLKTNSTGNVTSATFSVTDPKGQVSSKEFNFPSDCLCAIYGFQVDLVGPADGTHSCSFTSGAGILSYSVSSGTLVLQSVSCGGYGQPGTGETSNSVYGGVIPSGSSLTQNVVTTSTGYIYSLLGDGHLVIDSVGEATAKSTLLDIWQQSSGKPTQVWALIPSAGNTYDPKITSIDAAGFGFTITGEGFQAGSQVTATYTFEDPSTGGLSQGTFATSADFGGNFNSGGPIDELESGSPGTLGVSIISSPVLPNGGLVKAQWNGSKFTITSQ